MNFTKDEQLYLDAKKAYYEGVPIMEDDEFDALENYLKALDSVVIDYIGYIPTRLKFKHLSKMLSLNKIKAEKDTDPPFEEFYKWIEKRNITKLEITPKYDGNAVNLIYKNKTLHRALTRGDGNEGLDVTSKMELIVPKTLNQGNYVTLEIRGEVVMDKEVFKKLNEDNVNQFKNPRNYVAGVLGRKDFDKDDVKELRFIAYEVRVYDEFGEFDFIENYQEFLKDQFQLPWSQMGEVNLKDKEELKETFDKTFQSYLNYRDKVSPYQLDGFVIKAIDNETRKQLGYNSHDPEYALAIKFQPRLTITTINDIEWNLGKSGELTPVAQLEPVDLDGSTITKATLHNLRYIKNKGLAPGSIVSIAKMGDIIPQIISVIKPSNQQLIIPTHCPYCNHELVVDEIRLSCINVNCSGVGLFRLINAIANLKLDFFGEKTIEKIYEGGIHTAFDLFDKSKFNREFLINEVGMNDGKSVDRLINQLRQVKQIELKQVVLMLGINGLGKHVSTELARMVAGIEYSTYALEKKFFEIENIKETVLNYVKILEENGVNVMFPENKSEDKSNKTFEMTGSPKPFWNVKEDFVKQARAYGYAHTVLGKTTDYLITDSLDSNSSKMAKARKLGVEILTYEQMMDLLN